MENAGTTSLTDAARLVQLLKIDGYSTTKTVDNSGSHCIESRWNVDGQTRNYGSVRASLGCRVVDPRGILKPSEEKTVAGKFWHANSSGAKLSLVTRPVLESSGYLRDDALTLRCTITVLKELPVQKFPVKEVPAPAVPVPSSNLHSHLGELLQSEKGADVEFLVSGESFVAHKAVLAARSPVFMAQFYGDMMEKSCQSVEVKDMDAAVFKALLHFIYTDDDDTVPEAAASTVMMAQHLLAAADRYGLDRLKVICEGKLSGGIEVDTAAATLALAEQHGCGQLKDRCVEFIVGSPTVLDAVMATEGYKHLEASCPSVLTELLARAAKKLKRA